MTQSIADAHIATNLGVRANLADSVLASALEWITSYNDVAKATEYEIITLVGLANDLPYVAGYGRPIAHVRGRISGIDFILVLAIVAGTARIECVTADHLGIDLGGFTPIA